MTKRVAEYNKPAIAVLETQKVFMAECVANGLSIQEAGRKLGVDRQRDELKRQGRPYTDRSLAEFGAKQVGASPETVLKWMGAA